MNHSEVVSQLGGNKFITMTGANSFTKIDDNTLQFKVPKAKNRIKYIRIKLNSMDLYVISFYSQSGKHIKTIEDIYSDQLEEIFSQETGLYTRL